MLSKNKHVGFFWLHLRSLGRYHLSRLAKSLSEAQLVAWTLKYLRTNCATVADDADVLSTILGGRHPQWRLDISGTDQILFQDDPWAMWQVRVQLSLNFLPAIVLSAGLTSFFLLYLVALEVEVSLLSCLHQSQASQLAPEAPP